MPMLPPPQTPTVPRADHEPPSPWRRAELAVLFTMAVALQVALLTGFVYAALRYPAAILPAVVATVAGYLWFRRRHPAALRTPFRLRFQDLFGPIMAWGLLGGSVGYAVLAALRIGVPSPEAPAGWRVFGGAVFGAAAGVLGALLVSNVTFLVAGVLSLWRSRRAA